MACKHTGAARGISRICRRSREGPSVPWTSWQQAARCDQGCQCHTVVMAESCLSWTGQDRTSSGCRRATCILCVMDTTSALQACARGFAVGKLGLDTYDKVASEGLLGWCFVGLRQFQGSSCGVIFVLLGDFGESCFSLLCLGFPRGQTIYCFH